MKLRALTLSVLFSAAAVLGTAQEPAPLQMAPVQVKAGPLGFMGIRCSAEVGLFGIFSNSAHLKSLVITEVFKDSAALKAGLAVQDQILKISGVPVTELTVNDLKELGEREKGDRVELEVLSPGAKAPRSLVFALGARRAMPQ